MSRRRTRAPLFVFGLAGAFGAVMLTATGSLALFALRPSEQPLLLRRARRGGTGDVQVRLTWHSTNDLDLYMIDPKGNGICLHRRQVPSGGTLDVDMNATPPFSSEPMENIYWPRGRAPSGIYRIWVQYFAQHPGGPDPNPFKVRVTVRGGVYFFSGSISKRERFAYVGAFAVGNVPFDPETVDQKGTWGPGPPKPGVRAREAVR